MWKNNLLVAWRSILKHKLQTIINIAGLAIGIAGCLLVYLITNYELDFNQKIVDKDRIYRVYTEFSGSFSSLNPGVPMALPTATADFTGVAVQSHFFTDQGKVEIPAENNRGTQKEFKDEDDIIIAAPGYFDLIQNYEWLEGSPRQSLTEPFKVVLTEEKARTYFGIKDPREAIGREIIYQDSLHTTVSGILVEPDFQSDFHFTDFISYSSIEGSWLKEDYDVSNWDNVSSHTQLFLKLSEGTALADIEKQLQRISDQQNDKDKESDWIVDFKLQPLTDIHFNANMSTFDSGPKTAHMPTLYGLMLVAVLLLLIAAINFINMATVQASRRAKEVGIRKVIGGTRKHLAGQFLVETLLLAALALPLATILTEFAVRYFRDMLPEGMTFVLLDPAVMLFLLLTVTMVTLLSGLYPALVLSSYLPAFALKNMMNKSGGGKQNLNLRKGLIIFQFTLAQVFIIGAFIIHQQLNYVLHKDLGFDREQRIHFSFGWGTEASKKQVIKGQLEQLPNVLATSMSSATPIRRGWNTSIVKYNRDGEEIQTEVHTRSVDTAYLRLYNIPLIAGRNLIPADTVKEVLINETYAKALGFEDAEGALGESIKFSGAERPIVGVIKDFHIQSFHSTIAPALLSGASRSFHGIGVKFAAGKPLSENIEEAKAIWASVLPDRAFRYYILDETVEKLYTTEMQTSKLVNTATGLAIFISCLGLFGLAFFTVTQRTKEIGIRKVLGASIAGIVSLLSKDFFKLVVVSILLATPLAWYFMGKWLDGFAYSVGLQWWIFILAGLVVMVVAFATMSIQSVKAALSNPVEALRNE